MRIAAISSVTSMPTGHHVMHRPQPDAAARAELVDPRRELVGEPLAVAGVADSSEPRRTTCGENSSLKQLAHSRSRVASVAVERDLVREVVAEARRAHHRAVRAGEAPRRHLVPARVLAVAVQRVPAGRPSRASRPIRFRGALRHRERCGDLRVRRPRRHVSASRGRRRASVPASAVKPPSSSVSAMSYPVVHRGPVSIETQKQVSPGVAQFTPIATAPFATRAVGGIGDHEDLVLDLDRVQVAGAQSDERVANVGQVGAGAIRMLAVGVPRAGLDRLARREEVSLAGVGPVRPLEEAGRRPSARDGTCPGPWTSRMPAREVVDAVDAVEHDRAVADRGTDQLVAPLDQEGEEPAERVAFEVTGRHVHSHPPRHPPSVTGPFGTRSAGRPATVPVLT